jgi:hypothetical protein
MRKRLSVALVLLAMVTLVGVASAATAIVYGEVGPLKLCYLCGGTDGAGTSVEADSSARNFNTATTTIDTTLTYAIPEDIVWGAHTDSLPLMVRIERVDDQSGTANAGGAADSIKVALECNWGGTIFPVTARTSANNGWAFSEYGLVGTSTGGVAVFKPGIGLKTETLNAIGTYTGIPGFGATQFRVLAGSISVAAHPGRYRLFLRYPKSVH